MSSQTTAAATTPTSPPSPPANHQQPHPQGYAIELYFDPALENQVLKAWNVLSRRHISNHLISISSRPHLTLLSLPPSSLPDPLSLLPLLRSLSSRLDPLPVTLSSISTSPSPSSDLFLSPTPTLGLINMHAQLCELLKKEGVEVGEEFRVDRWVPRCAVAEGVAKSRMAEAFCVLRDLKIPVSGYAVDVGLVEFEPVKEIFSFPLGGGGEAS